MRLYGGLIMVDALMALTRMLTPSLSFMLPDFDPVVHIGSFALQWGPLAIRWYALAYLAGIALGWYYGTRLLKNAGLWPGGRAPIEPLKFDDMVLWLALGIILGGRLMYVLVYNLPETLRNPASVLVLWEGGMSFHGGFLGVVVAGILFARAEKLDLTRILGIGDVLASVAPIGLGLGRLANFINGELWGRPTSVPWGVVFCNEHTRTLYNGGCGPAGFVARHPSQLYEAALEGVFLFAAAFLLGRVYKQFKRPGLVWGVFMLGYGLSRILLENVRNPDEQLSQFVQTFHITMGMLLSLPMVGAGAWLIWRALKTPPIVDEPEAAAVPPEPAPTPVQAPKKRAGRAKTDKA
jgi:phosphatidylglycerol---prolipoprotein diacylglyceryl transferase